MRNVHLNAYLFLDSSLKEDLDRVCGFIKQQQPIVSFDDHYNYLKNLSLGDLSELLSYVRSDKGLTIYTYYDLD